MKWFAVIYSTAFGGCFSFEWLVFENGASLIVAMGELHFTPTYV